MEYQPVVSVVIPTYNHAHLLREAIDSVRRQTFTEWEMIVVNNYSEDDTEAVVASFSDPRIRLVNFRNNGVIAASRNRGIALARGDYVAFLDSDDKWYPEKLERCMTVLAKGNDLVCHSEAWVKDGAAFKIVNYGPLEAASYETLLFGRNCLSTSAIVVRRVCLDRVGCFSEDSAFIAVEDYELWLKLARAGCRFAFVDVILGEYHLHKTNNSRFVLRQMRAELAVLRRHFSQKDGWSLMDRLRLLRRLGRVYLAYGFRWARSSAP